MATQHTIEPGQVMHQAATQLMEIDWVDQKTAKQISPMAEAVANMVTVLYYQAETGLACRDDFLEAQVTLRQAMPFSDPE
ncbi:MAG: type I toxin-antitoxin system ptaRNA1 family toxin [Candidatus Thiodiazotropha weberae]|nr:type I toxin-antitoxin system ptaRNA1 family toxin [Candidatus Thiodiazotropha lotti]MCG8011416.1 type I toxin-antitoxin system ptaRNA1 family toxin [Candidatus Thiodiazotropha lotti]MCG8020904.1 type I toxin-antitoxin system ptaRNA1 family toxin [Candidatus Thiodiazotropha lotti]MCW4208070.1 type I toxin-antitoxin system ptaRNA1 family toxin [Candidatus Thiodiazotropha lotti]MCW4210881.1 type I toxin-antitoxin system ptaRNA1 family toxin [Candidatus Thiodiazotropha lotti]